jgi:hypothetical protein
MNKVKTRLILIFCFSLFISKVYGAGTEGGICRDCSLNQQTSSQIVTSTRDLGSIVNALGAWVNVETPKKSMATQLEAGYPNGCGITSMLYALKLGPINYRQSYEKIPGKTDVEKIRFLVAKFKAMRSKDKPEEAAFSDQYGTNPNDLPWMFQSLVAGSNPLKEMTFLKPTANGQTDKKMLEDFQQKGAASLSEGKPLIVQLQYTNPNKAHAILITGMELQSSQHGSIKVQILDPLSGRTSIATVAAGAGKLADSDFSMLTFSGPAISSRNGFLLSIAW